MLITENKYRAANEKLGLSADFNIEQFLTDLTETVTMIAGVLDKWTFQRCIDEMLPKAIGQMVTRPEFRRQSPNEMQQEIAHWDSIFFMLQRLRDLFTPLVVHNENELESLLKAVMKPDMLLLENK